MSPILAAIQTCPRFAASPADLKDNFRKAYPLMKKAAQLGASLVVMPELCLTGYSFLDEGQAALVAEPVDGDTFRAFREYAMSADCYVAYGFVEDSGTDLHNSAVVISPTGELVLLSRKCFLAGTDYLWATPSKEEPPIARTGLGLLSAVVCRDLKNDHPDKGEDGLFGGKKVDVVAGLTNWGKGFFPSSKWVEFAEENSCTLVVSNRWGTESNVTEEHGEHIAEFGQGGSAIIEAHGKVHIGGLVFGKDCVVAARLEGGQ